MGMKTLNAPDDSQAAMQRPRLSCLNLNLGLELAGPLLGMRVAGGAASELIEGYVRAQGLRPITQKGARYLTIIMIYNNHIPTTQKNNKQPAFY